MNTYLVEFAKGGATRLVRAEGWFDDGRSYLMLDRFRVDHDARLEHREVVELFAKADLAEPPRLVERAARPPLPKHTGLLVSEPSRSVASGRSPVAELPALPDIGEAAESVLAAVRG